MEYLVKKLKERGVPIDGVGFQMHLNLDSFINFDQIKVNIDNVLKKSKLLNLIREQKGLKEFF